MKIYNYYAGEIHELEVRETKKMYINDGNPNRAFNYLSRFDKETFHLSPLEAVQSAINTKVSFRQKLIDKIQNIDSELITLMELEKVYSQK